MKLLTVLAVVLVFLAGFLSSHTYIQMKGSPVTLTGFVSMVPSPDSNLTSPQDHIKPRQIHVLNDRVIIKLNGTSWAKFTDSGSMVPVLDEHANSLEIKPESPTQVRRGDIISYRTPEGLIIHRVIDTGQDSMGWYAVTKGDKSSMPDPYLVRFQDITGIVVGIFY